jgi:hypothetical protein
MHTIADFVRKNAKRAAETMIRKGTAPAVDYAVEPSDDGRFKIVWKTAKAAPTDEAETESAEASADQPAAASSCDRLTTRASGHQTRDDWRRAGARVRG